MKYRTRTLLPALLALTACGGGSDVTSAQECFNPAVWGFGAPTSFLLKYRNYALPVSDPLANASDVSYEGTASRAPDGLTGVVATRRSSTPEASYNARTTETFTLDRGVLQWRTREFKDERPNPCTVQPFVPTYDPPVQDSRFLLAVGENHQEDTSMTSLVHVSTQGGCPVYRAGGRIYGTYSMTYRGQEIVTVPAGTFTACHFSFQEGGVLREEFIAKGTGVLVKALHPSFISPGNWQLIVGSRVTELLPGSTVDGVPLNGTK
jgi:hypothetical protein